ncbi:MarR family winged helix-turn-helix transcriptional regulator [Companilactobacillus sp. FL22-1]|uniref:MarR family winged helix-turn-helix transcriptional regulator n=1 Tax=Companilactobacillus sp. FL22-1 TaxID=3373892 RepID=UPI003754DE2E
MSEKYTNRLLKIAANRITKKLDLFAQKYDLTWMQMSVIDFLSRKNDQEIFQSDIEKEFYIQRSTATVLLQRMEKRDLIYRRLSTSDARQKSVFLTEKSHKLEIDINHFMQNNQELLENNFSAAEIAIFEKILNFYVQGGNTDE